MSVDKLVDSIALDSDLGNIANAIRTKGGTNLPLTFPSDFISAINALRVFHEYNGNVVNFTTASATNLLKLNVEIEPVQYGSGTPSPGNIRPISGWDKVNVYRTGKNLLVDGTWDVGQYENGVWVNSMYRRTSPYSAIVPGIQYHASIDLTETNNLAWINYNYFDKNKTWLGNRVTNGDPTFNGYREFTCTIHDEKARFIRVTCKRKSSDQDISSVDVLEAEPQLELGSVATAYEPYTGTSVTIDLDGTRYGGILDVTTGVLKVTYANISSYAGETLPGMWISSMDVYSPGTQPTTGAQVVYELGTPFSVLLSQETISTLARENNIWADTGDSTLWYVE